MPVVHAPSDNGRSGATGDSRSDARRPVIGMLIRGLWEQYEKQWLGAVDSAAALDVDLITFVGSELEPPDAMLAPANRVYDLVSAHALDGLLVCTTSLEIFVGHERMADFATRYADIPMVSLERSLGEAPYVRMSDRDGMREAVEHLITAHGRRTIGFVRGPSNHAGSQDRLQGYRDALQRHGIAVDEGLITTPTQTWEAAEAFSTTMALLDSGARPDAVAAANDDYAIGVLSALQAHGLRTPADVAVIGYDDSVNVRANDVAYGFHTRLEAGVVRKDVNLSAGSVALTTVRAPMRDMAWRAVENLVGLIRGESVPHEVTVPTVLVVRRSCGCFPSAVDAEVPTIADALGADAQLLPRGWGERLAEAFASGTVEGFLPVLDDYVRQYLHDGGSVDPWWSVIEVLQRARPTEALRLPVQLFLNDAAQRSSRFVQAMGEKRDQIIREVGQRLITAPDVEHLATAMAEELPKIGMMRCYVSQYSGTPDEGGGGSAYSRLIFGLEDGHPISVGDEEFASVELVPGPRLQRDRPASFVVTPLHFGLHSLGFAVFEVGPRTGWMYEAVQEQIASALQSAQLVERERRALAAVEEARADLERRVAERTAELAAANEGLTQEIAERQRAEEMQLALENQLRQAQKMEAVGRLAGGVAHDFNNLLVVINGNSDGILHRLPETDALREEVEDIRHAGERAANLTRQLLAFSRQQVLHPRMIDVNDVIVEVRSMLGRMIGEDVVLTTDLMPDLPPVWADAGQLEQIIFNIAVNARDAMPEGGELTMATAAVDLDDRLAQNPGSYVRLSITDTGVGMEETVQARLFEPFFTTKAPGKGTGLGLATVFGIVQQSGGHITVQSKPGRGTTFEVYLRQASSRRDEGVEAAVSPESPRGTETVLLVEDDPDVRRAARRFLVQHGYDVLVAVDGQDALRLLAEYTGSVDLVITDVVMPNMGGRELAGQLRIDRPEVPVLFVSGYASSSAREGLSDERVELLEKPFTAQTLAARVRELLDAVG